MQRIGNIFDIHRARRSPEELEVHADLHASAPLSFRSSSLQLLQHAA